MRPPERAAQSRRELDRKLASANLEPVEMRPRLGWIRAIRIGLGMSQAALAERLRVSAVAVSKLEHAEREGRITLHKLEDVARALDCHLVYALVPNSTLEETVTRQAQVQAAELLGYTAQTMALEAQGIDEDRHAEAIKRYAQELVSIGRLWRGKAPQRRRRT